MRGEICSSQSGRTELRVGHGTVVLRCKSPKLAFYTEACRSETLGVSHVSCHTRLDSPCACGCRVSVPLSNRKPSQLAPRLTRSCISTPACLENLAAHPIKANTPFAFFSVTTTLSTADGAINCAKLVAYSVEVAPRPCKVVLPSEFTCLFASGQDAVLLVDW